MSIRAYPNLPFSKNPLRSRADVQTLLVQLVEPLLPHFSPGKARVVAGENRALYGDPAGLLEGFARPLWGLVPLAAGGGTFEHFHLWQEGIAAGTDPAHPEYWGLAGDYDQRSVEQAAFGFALALAPQVFWQQLAPDVRTRLVAWLSRINEVKLVRSNWLFFRVLVNAGLARCGEKSSPEKVDADLKLIDEFYLGNGWYQDGVSGPPDRDGRRGDYYVPMALHLYALIYSRIATDADPGRIARYVERARHFSNDFVHYFAADGAALPFGRSLTYRFAQGSFWGGLAFAAVEALPWGVIKGLYMRHLRWWMRQPIFSETGMLSIGYAYPNILMAESYNSSGSPYWALKMFLPLALPETHPFWKAEEAPLPKRRTVHSIPEAGLVLTTEPRTKDVTGISPGQPVWDWPRTAPHKYSKVAYSTRFAFCVPAGPATIPEGGLDTGVSLSDDNRFFRVREHCKETKIRDGVVFSSWEAWPGVVLETWTLAEPACHLRIHRLKTDRKLWLLEGGFAVPYTEKRTLELKPKETLGAIVRAPQGASAMRPLLGTRTPECAEIGANSSLMMSLSAMPFLRSAHEPGEHWLACVAAGAAAAGEMFDMLTEYAVTRDTAGIQVSRHGQVWWSSGDQPTGASSEARLSALAELV